MEGRVAVSFLDGLEEAGAVGIIRTKRPETAVTTGLVLAEGGMSILEVTFTVPGAVQVITKLRAELPGVLIGAGTITTAKDVAAAKAAGAEFLVSPGCTEDLLGSMMQSGLPFLPGVSSPSELLMAKEAGADVLKLFPAGLLGPDYLRQLRGPFPDVALVPTGGVQIEHVSDFLRAGALAVGLSSPLCSEADIEERRWDSVLERVSQLRGAVFDVRG